MNRLQLRHRGLVPQGANPEMRGLVGLFNAGILCS
jgi:hypothetical protein